MLQGNAFMVWVCRMLWSFARDGGVPFHKVWSTVNRFTGTPVNSVWAMVSCTCLSVVCEALVRVWCQQMTA